MGDFDMPVQDVRTFFSPQGGATPQWKAIFGAFLAATALSACEPPNRHPEPIQGPYLERISGAWSPREEKAPCPSQKVPLLVGSFAYDMSQFCGITYAPF